METRIIAINQNRGAGEFSLQGACATPVNAKEETHASAFGHVMAGCMADVHRRYAAGRGQDDKQPDACTMDRFLGVGKR